MKYEIIENNIIENNIIKTQYFLRRKYWLFNLYIEKDFDISFYIFLAFIVFGVSASIFLFITNSFVFLFSPIIYLGLCKYYNKSGCEKYSTIKEAEICRDLLVKEKFLKNKVVNTLTVKKNNIIIEK